MKVPNKYGKPSEKQTFQLLRLHLRSTLNRKKICWTGPCNLQKASSIIYSKPFTSLSAIMHFKTGNRVLQCPFWPPLKAFFWDVYSIVSRVKWTTFTFLPMTLCGSWRTPPEDWVKLQQSPYFSAHCPHPPPYPRTLNNVYQALGWPAAQFAGARRGPFKMYTKYCTFPSVENKVKG